MIKPWIALEASDFMGLIGCIFKIKMQWLRFGSDYDKDSLGV